ncbi:hypothetical protein SDC9_171233 [bioreactor metagenome]|uniref:Uncharacterized protein n=1 Tax=bioreactor metagenome TaxID=1076179 RepID=A0A645GCN6_9ZZZZ
MCIIKHIKKKRNKKQLQMYYTNIQIEKIEKYCTNFTKKVTDFVLKSKKNIDKSVKSYI